MRGLIGVFKGREGFLEGCERGIIYLIMRGVLQNL